MRKNWESTPYTVLGERNTTRAFFIWAGAYECDRTPLSSRPGELTKLKLLLNRGVPTKMCRGNVSVYSGHPSSQLPVQSNQ